MKKSKLINHFKEDSVSLQTQTFSTGGKNWTGGICIDQNTCVTQRNLDIGDSWQTPVIRDDTNGVPKFLLD